jgi:hypothetical protein
MTDIYKKKIIITKNKKNDNNGNKGIKIISKNFNIFSDVSNNVYNQREFRDKNTDIINNEIKNKIILSYKIKTQQQSAGTSVNTIDIFNLITKYNLKNNIKHFYYYKNGSRIIFTKSNASVSNDLYLVDFSGVEIENKKKWYVKINNKEVSSEEIKDNSFIELNYNFYNKYENSDYYKFKFRDFIDLSNILNISSRETYNNDYQITYNNIELSNNFLDNSYINYNKSDFETIYCLSVNSVNVLTKPSSTSSSTLLQDICDNLLIYNKLGNNTIINVDYNNVPPTNLPTNYRLNDISINFEIIKTPNIYSKYYGKILLNSNFTYLNTNVLGNNTNIPGSLNLSLNDNSKVYLSLGNGITGLTQKKIFNNIKFTTDNVNLNKIRKINFTNPANIRSKSSNYNNDYLLNDLSYNDNETNIFSVIKKLPRDGPTGLSNKVEDISLINFFSSISNDSDISKNIFLTGLKNIEVSNNNINYDFFDNSYNLSKVGISNDTIIKSNNDFRIIITPSNITSPNYNINYDFRYNYDDEAFSTLLLTFTYNDSQNSIYNMPLNFYKAILSNEYITLEAGDFKDVACIFVYHDPEDSATNIKYTYPNNNIQVITDITIDNLSKAIELLPNAKSGTSNSIFIPAKNGSNLSKKQIQGLIGFGKEGIPRLLSIEPYDDNSRVGRGFNNQFNLNDGTLDPSNLKLTNSEIVALKYNSQKHISQKQTNNITNKRNFADLVKSSARSRNINLNAPSSCSNEPPNIPKEKYYTPFRMFKTNKGNYLRSGK